MIIEKLNKRFLKFKSHPLTQKNPYAALFRYFLFNVKSKINNSTRIYTWINDLRFYAQRGDAGIVPNIYFKLFDYEDSMFILDTLSDQDVFVDVGANVGHFTLLAASKKCSVYSFEPIPEAFEKLKRNILLNNLKVNLFNKGVGADNAILKFSTERGVMNSVVLDSNAAFKEIEVVKLDDELKSVSPTMLKIDVEGYEWFVLQGATQILKNEKLKYILIELNQSGSKFSINDEAIHQLLFEHGFYPFSYDCSNKVLNKISSFRQDKFNTLYVRN